jgi:hypothetical protein
MISFRLCISVLSCLNCPQRTLGFLAAVPETRRLEKSVRGELLRGFHFAEHGARGVTFDAQWEKYPDTTVVGHPIADCSASTICFPELQVSLHPPTSILAERNGQGYETSANGRCA